MVCSKSYSSQISCINVFHDEKAARNSGKCHPEYKGKGCLTREKHSMFSTSISPYHALFHCTYKWKTKQRQKYKHGCVMIHISFGPAIPRGHLHLTTWVNGPKYLTSLISKFLCSPRIAIRDQDGPEWIKT